MSIKTGSMSFWDIRIDFDKSHGSYVFDKNTNRYYLDLFSMYSSLPIGYNHPVFDDSFHEEMKKISNIKVTNCEFQTDLHDKFCQEFYDFAGLNYYDCFHFTCTGSLAVECAVKLAMDYTKKKRVVTIKNSFHGIHSYGNFTTGRDYFPVSDRLSGYPDLNWPKIETIEELQKEIDSGDIAAILVEPIQATFGDNHLDKKFLRNVASTAKLNKIPLIFDEIQTGFGTTGKPWYFQYLNIKPDIVIFGKKSQVSGVMTRPEYFHKNGNRLSVTFDGDIVDMLRSIYIMKAYKEGNLLETANWLSRGFARQLREIDGINNTRCAGCLIGFDLEDRETRDSFVENIRTNGMICNPTGEKSVRLRPNLAVTSDELEEALNIIRKSL
tara:strand:- start:4608 stop:5753 length:1146 start_codon:yes stop_codon:yes gene_type:complete